MKGIRPLAGLFELAKFEFICENRCALHRFFCSLRAFPLLGNQIKNTFGQEFRAGLEIGGIDDLGITISTQPYVY